MTALTDLTIIVGNDPLPMMIFLTPQEARPMPNGQLKRPSPNITSHNDLGKNDDKVY